MNDTSSHSRPRTQRSSSTEDRRAALWKGLPAAIIAVLGLSALVFASDRNSKLEQKYRRWAEDASKERIERTQKLVNDLRLMTAGEPATSTFDDLIPPDDERRVALDRVSTSERLYYEKLISLNSTEPEYRFQFASACINSGSTSDQQRGLSLMLALAPHNQTGYYKAHLWWTDHFAQLIQLRRMNPLVGAELIYNHAEFCLKRQANDKSALRRKGEAAMKLGRNDAAREAYQILFESEPLFFTELLTINQRLGRTKANEDLFRTAKNRFESRLREDLPVDKWVENWEALLTCLVGLSEHEEAVTRLRREIDKQKENNNSINRVFIERLLARTMVSLQLAHNSTNNTQFTHYDVELMTEAYQLDPKNPAVLQTLTRMAVNDDAAIAEASRKIYDPLNDPSPSALVLNELGIAALAKQDYATAMNYMERARQLDPRNTMTLNNLAYVYLVSEHRNPERALKLIDDAIRLVQNPDIAKSVMTFFLDTRGTALMQLNRMPEAIAAYELALQDRPDNIKIIEALIKCYEASNLSAEAYKERLRKLTGS